MAPHPSPTFRRRLAVLPCAVVLLLAACGASGGETTGPSTTAGDQASTTVATTKAATTEPQLDGDLGQSDGIETDTTSEGTADGGAIDLDALEALLPDAEVAGEGFHSESDVEEGYDEPDDLDATLDDQCPSAADLLDDVVEGGRVGRAFQGDGDRMLRVVLDPTPDSAWDEDRLDLTIAAAQGCGPVQAEQGGATLTADLAIERNDTYGDRGVAAHAVVTVEADGLPHPVEITVAFRAWVVGSVLVVTSSTDGVDDATYETIPADHERVETVSADLEEQLGALVD